MGPRWSRPEAWWSGFAVVKDTGEVARMERAAAIADDALGSVLPAAGGGGFGSGPPR